MPVTPAHAAAAWPLRKIAPRLPLSALVIGAMSPDYEYFLRLAPITRMAHKPAGLIFFCLPVSLVVWLVFRRLVRPALLELLPPGLAASLGNAASSWPLALAAMTLGAISHVFWDGFTHQNDWAVDLWPALRSRPLPDLLPLPWYKLLQYASSIVGSLALVAWAARWTASRPARDRAWSPGQRSRSIRVVGWILFVSAVCGIADSLMGSSHAAALDPGRAVVGAMLGCVVAVLVFSLTRLAATGRGASP
jgi:hypothetical protein